MAQTRNRFWILLLPALLLLLGACQAVQPTAYGPATVKNDYGYKDQQLDAETWRITVAGNTRTERDLVENQLLYRAAEIALANGADGFVVLERDVERDVRYSTLYDPFYAYPYGGFWGYRPFYAYGGYSAGFGMAYGGRLRAETRTSTRYTAYAEIRLYEGTAPAGEGVAYDARQVTEKLTGKVNKTPPAAKS